MRALGLALVAVVVSAAGMSAAQQTPPALPLSASALQLMSNKPSSIVAPSLPYGPPPEAAAAAQAGPDGVPALPFAAAAAPAADVVARDTPAAAAAAAPAAAVAAQKSFTANGTVLLTSNINARARANVIDGNDTTFWQSDACFPWGYVSRKVRVAHRRRGDAARAAPQLDCACRCGRSSGNARCQACPVSGTRSPTRRRY